MHEFALAKDLVEIILAELNQQTPPVRLRSATVVVGGLRQVVPEYLSFAYALWAKATPAEGSELEIRRVPIVLRCACGWQGEAEAPPFWCAACHSPQVDLISGRELFLENLEVE